jgi:hypothetical protein
VAPAKGYLLRTSSVSDDESDSEVEIEVMRANCVRVVEPAQTITRTHLVKTPNYPIYPGPTPGGDNKRVPSFNGGPPDWKVVPEGTTSIPIIGQLLPQDYVEEIRTSLTIPEGCFTASPYGLRHGKPDTHSGTNGDSGGPAPGINCPGAGSGDATPSTPTLQEPPSAEC